MQQLPEHIAIIMDGNGRWATARGMARGEGHKAGAETVNRVLEYCHKYGIKYLTLYAFSTENWKRSSTEVTGLWSLLTDYLQNKAALFEEKQIRLQVIGDISRLPLSARIALKHVIDSTAKYQNHVLTLALNYGGRAELLQAARQIALDATNGKLDAEHLTEEQFSRYLQTNSTPDPDLMIRTAGEIRLSNFLLWQLSYSELYFTPVLWPDFNEDNFKAALDAYASRKRNFGAVLDKTSCSP